MRALRDDQIFAKKVKKEKNEGEFEVENFKNLSIKHGEQASTKCVASFFI